MTEDIATIIVDENAIQQRVAELGRQISEDYQDRDLILVAIINGALLFTADLIRHITVPVKLDCIRVSSYQGGITPASEPRIIDPIRIDIEGENVLLIDDILDTGKTLRKVVKQLEAHKPLSIATCVLLDKQTNRHVSEPCDYVGFNIADHFVVGYGLDFAERYRHLPYIGVLKPELQNPPEWV